MRRRPCALDVADRGGTTLEEVGASWISRERILRRVEVEGLAVAALRDMSTLRTSTRPDRRKRRLPVLQQLIDEDEPEEEGDEDVDEGELGETAVAVEVNAGAFSVDLD